MGHLDICPGAALLAYYWHGARNMSATHLNNISLTSHSPRAHCYLASISSSPRSPRLIDCSNIATVNTPHCSPALCPANPQTITRHKRRQTATHHIRASTGRASFGGHVTCDPHTPRALVPRRVRAKQESSNSYLTGLNNLTPPALAPPVFSTLTSATHKLNNREPHAQRHRAATCSPPHTRA